MRAEDVRWKQRFANFSRALGQLNEGLENVPDPTDLQKEGIIQRFELTHELAWNVMRDFLKARGVRDIYGSKDATRHAFAHDLIDDGEVWMAMIESRNQTVHTYHQNILITEFEKIKTLYQPKLQDFHGKMLGFE